MERVLVFDLAGERHALPAAGVLKVVEMGPLSRLPRLPPCVVGITHHRGRVVTVVDLAQLIKPSAPPTNTATGRLILAEKGGLNVGLLTGPVAEITSLDPAAGSPPVRPGTLVARVHVHQGQALNLLNAELLFNRIGRLCLAEDTPLLVQSASALPAGASTPL
jgi:chemotaxis signal transduction protein